MSRIKRYCIINLLIVLCITSGCSNKKGNTYNEFLDGFYDSYFQITETLYHCDPEQVVNLMATEEIQNEMSSIEDLLDNIKDDVPDDKEKNYKKLSEWYEELLVLGDKKYEDWWGVTVKERITVQNTLLDIAIRYSDWQDKDSGVIWDK
ncbi:hypothetical protein [Vallitalea guaymasensis]|uniref:hypothetical protein n=1 Tax=Vallitalea guaymasensis TaxID=1185412 RepID=UPI000DE21C91|nr:hypothetical protein [Vallitalea guaymasensis]